MKTTWEALIAGKSGIDYITACDTTKLETKIAGEVKGFEPTDFINRKDARRMDRFAQLAVAASMQAVKQSKLIVDASNQDNIGVIIGSGIGGLLGNMLGSKKAGSTPSSGSQSGFNLNGLLGR